MMRQGLMLTRAAGMALRAPAPVGARARMFSRSARALEIHTVKVPQMAESISEGTLREFVKQKGEFVGADEEVASIETDKIDVGVNAPVAGVIVETLANPEDNVEVGQDLFKIDDSQTEGAAPPKEEAPKEEAPKAEAPKEAPKAEAPKEAPKETPKPAAPPKKEAAPAPEPPKAKGARTETRVKVTRMRARIAERLKEAQNTAASLTTFNEIDMSSLIEFRAANKDRILKETGVKLGFMSPFIKASSKALLDIPAANSSLEGDHIVYRDYTDVSIAVASPKGLVTPVLRNTESQSFLEIEKSMAHYAGLARDGKLSLEDMQGGSFTISNGGVFGSLFGTPILNPPQAAILGMHGVKDKPVVVDGKIVIRPIMVVALTYDHRLLDGREAVTFLVKVKEYIEDPRTLLL